VDGDGQPVRQRDGVVLEGSGGGPGEGEHGGLLPPAAASFEKEGSVTNSGGWGSGGPRRSAPSGSRTDAEIMNDLYFKIKAMYAKEGGVFPTRS